MNLKFRLNIIITLLLLLMLLAGAVLMVRSAKSDVQAEVASTANLALHLLDAEILYYTSDYAWLNIRDKSKATIFRLESLGDIRHLRIEFVDAYGRVRDSNRGGHALKSENQPPIWFQKMMQLDTKTMHQERRTVFASGRVIGELVVTPDPSYEIAEIWEDVVGMLALVVIFFIVVNCMVYWAVGRALKPVDLILQALTEIEQGKLASRLPLLKLPELSGIGMKFNAMAQALEQSTQENRRLTSQMISVQEDERKSLARDLHDEIGQCLTAINVDAMTVLNARKIGDAKESALAITQNVRRMMDILHGLLQKLRPGVLDELGLGAALRDLVGNWRQRNRSVSISVSLDEDICDVNETTAIAIYRIAQECLTNISRHAHANRMTLALRCNKEQIMLMIQDDGQGFDVQAIPNGYGLAGMRERVKGLGGRFNLQSGIYQGTSIQVVLPVKLEERIKRKVHEYDT